MAPKALATVFQTKYPVQLRECDLGADAGEKTDQHGTREKIGEKTEAEAAGKKKQSARHQGHQARQRDVLRAADIRGQRGTYHGCRGGIGRDHEMPR